MKWRLWISCAEATELTSATLDQQLPLVGRCHLALHLLICAWCRRYARQIVLVRRALQRAAERHVDRATLTADARERMKLALRREPAEEI